MSIIIGPSAQPAEKGHHRKQKQIERALQQDSFKAEVSKSFPKILFYQAEPTSYKKCGIPDEGNI